MAADRTTTADTGTEDLEGSSAPERPTPPDTLGAADAPSRADSRAAAAAANDTASGEGDELGADKPEAAQPSEDPTAESDVVEDESESPASSEVNEPPVAAPHEHPAETEPGEVAEGSQNVDESAPRGRSTEAAEPAVDDGASAAGHAPEPLDAGENEAAMVEPPDGGEAAGADTVDGEAGGRGKRLRPKTRIRAMSSRSRAGPAEIFLTRNPKTTNPLRSRSRSLSQYGRTRTRRRRPRCFIECRTTCFRDGVQREHLGRRR